MRARPANDRSPGSDPEPPEIARIRDALQDDPDLRLATVYGSAATGDLRSESDVDVAVLDAKALDAPRKIALIERIASATGRPVDLVDLRTAGTVLLREILTRGRVVFERDREDRMSLIMRMLVEVEDFLPIVERERRERRNEWLGTSE